MKNFFSFDKTKGIKIFLMFLVLFIICSTITLNLKMKRFSNLDKTKGSKGLLALLKWKFTSKKSSTSLPWPERIFCDKKDVPPSAVGKDSVRVSSVGHATFLIQHGDKNILTDPVWSQRIGPFGIGIKRLAEVGIEFDDLPPIDFVLISHNHYDHLDLFTLEKLQKKHKPVFVVPLGNERILKKAMPNAQVHSLNWYDFKTFDDFKIHLVPSQHWSSRAIIDRNRDLWGGFVIETKETQVCFIGDSGYSKEMFEEIGRKFTNILFAILPIGAYEPRWFMEDVHMNPREALLAYLDMKAKFFIPTHFDVFKLADDGYGKALEDYFTAKKELQINQTFLLKPGEFVVKSIKD